MIKGGSMLTNSFRSHLNPAWHRNITQLQGDTVAKIEILKPLGVVDVNYTKSGRMQSKNIGITESNLI